MVGVGGPARRSPPPPWVKFPYRDHPDSEIRALLIAEQFNPRGSFRIPCEDLRGPQAPWTTAEGREAHQGHRSRDTGSEPRQAGIRISAELTLQSAKALM